ncbi:MAG: hypothetical protein FWF06_08760 [Symbiobacteriaceae bacterium]|nr:hypothetical protein [Symbiobacteriaceae bacterium]
MRRTLPLIIAFCAGMVMLLDSYFNITFVNNFAQRYLMRTVVVSIAWASGIGALNLIRLHVRNISQKRQNWKFSYVLVIAFFFMALHGFLLKGNTTNPFYTFFYSSTVQNLSATVYSLNAYYMVSACYRSFRARSLEAAFLLISACIVMLGSVPVGAFIWEGFPKVSDWIMTTINDSAVRAMTIGTVLGSLSQSMRNLVGLERGHLSGGDG